MSSVSVQSWNGRKVGSGYLRVDSESLRRVRFLLNAASRAGMRNSDTWCDSILSRGILFHTLRGPIEPEESGDVIGYRNARLEDVVATAQTTRGRSQDRAKVAGGQDHEVKYEAGKTGATKAEVKSAVKSVGNSRKKVEDKLGKK